MVSTRIVSLPLLVVALVVACLLGGCGDEAAAGEGGEASPSPAPAWLAAEAAAQAERLGDLAPEAAFWRYDSVHDSYTIVLIGEFHTAHSISPGVCSIA